MADEDLVLSKQEMRDLSFQLLVEFSFSTLRTLIDAAGSDRAIALNRPYWHHAGNAAAIILRNNMGWKPGSIQAINDMYAFIGYINRLEFEYVNIEGTDWQETHIHSCPFDSAPPEFCFLLDNVVANGMVEVFDPSRKVVFDQTKTQGAPYCVMRLIEKGTAPKRPRGPEKHSRPPLITGMSREEADSWAVQYIAEHWVMLTRAMMDYEGSEMVLRKQLTSMRELGMAFGLRLKEQSTSSEERLESIAHYLSFANQLFLQEGELILIGRSRAEREIRSCPFQHAPPALCLQYEAFMSGICEVIDPELQVSYDHMMTKGDGTCCWTLERKATEPKSSEKEREEKVGAEDPVKVLALRLAKGEITEEEFDRKRRLLKG